MKHIKMSKVKVIQSDSAADFEDRLNNALTEVCELNSSYSIHFNMSMGHCAYIEYSYTQSIPENLADEYELRGEHFYCGNCPRFIPSMDGRSRYGTCSYGVVKRPLPSDSACNTFYTNYENGTWKER